MLLLLVGQNDFLFISPFSFSGQTHPSLNIFLFFFVLLPRLSRFLPEKSPPCVFLLWNIFLLFLLLYNALSLRAGGVGGWSQFGDTMQNMHNAAKLRWSHWKLWKNNNFFRERQNTIKELLAIFFVSSITTSGPCEISRNIEKCFGHFPYLGGYFTKLVPLSSRNLHYKSL